MRTGQYKDRLTFIEQGALKVALNGDILGSETSTRTLWAKVQPMNPTRALRYGQILNGHPYEISIRHQPNWAPAANMLIDWQGKRLTIISVVGDLKKQEYQLLAVAAQTGQAVAVELPNAPVIGYGLGSAGFPMPLF